eukprot:CAMPEP_0182914746 /NCGR_PEP_ID=MMETSP0034_2-20130328/38729_1 /TAXON_ID=156128 /ORGANISM="Nephroselmis pyriformis, Strain CCMP717" /LENGTH=148 /DNA_ID=CAMNT_0025051529 /DNA_START=531 /DNA_END=974 /DNA_ORIENTATION=-
MNRPRDENVLKKLLPGLWIRSISLMCSRVMPWKSAKLTLFLDPMPWPRGSPIEPCLFSEGTEGILSSGSPCHPSMLLSELVSLASSLCSPSPPVPLTPRARSARSATAPSLAGGTQRDYPARQAADVGRCSASTPPLQSIQTWATSVK